MSAAFEIRWTAEQDDMLRSMVEAGKTRAEIGQAVGRTAEACKVRAKLLKCRTDPAQVLRNRADGQKRFHSQRESNLLPFLLERVMHVPRGRSTPCWEWQGTIDQYGYSEVRIRTRKTRGHRLMYELSVGKIPDGLVIDHLCRNRRCINPAHLEPVTSGENVRRGFISRRIERADWSSETNHIGGK